MRRPLKIVVVEDNRDVAEMLKLTLEVAGHDVAVAHAGPDALAAVRAHAPHVVLCDLGLPGMSGFDVARTLKADPAAREVRVVALTGSGRPEDREASELAGFDAFLMKPVDPQVLEQTLATLLDARDQPDQRDGA